MHEASVDQANSRQSQVIIIVSDQGVFTVLKYIEGVIFLSYNENSPNFLCPYSALCVRVLFVNFVNKERYLKKILSKANNQKYSKYVADKHLRVSQ